MKVFPTVKRGEEGMLKKHKPPLFDIPNQSVYIVSIENISNSR
jgi:hypothetical protein